ncbi:MAG TPA: hypothetical protein VMR74_16630 [Gammaproteobacteria bacterium]|nr:hypothetical protein [Gammaproteobacteria bacterium]
MSEKPHQFRPPLYHKERDGNAKGAPGRESNGKRRESNGIGRGSGGDAGREQQGWDAYRKWLSSMNGQPRSRRAPIDHSVYSWKGYHSWADRVRQAWKSEDS